MRAGPSAGGCLPSSVPLWGADPGERVFLVKRGELPAVRRRRHLRRRLASRRATVGPLIGIDPHVVGGGVRQGLALLRG
eukprot:1750564-Pyramimonas_sp.AAC.1